MAALWELFFNITMIKEKSIAGITIIDIFEELKTFEIILFKLKHVRNFEYL